MGGFTTSPKAPSRHTMRRRSVSYRRMPRRRADSMPPPAILTHDLKKFYGAKAAVDGVDLEVPRGSFFGFLGPNGAGKSTTIRMLTGLIPADGGSIEILGFKLPGDDLYIKRRIGLVPDELLLFDRLTGADFLEFVGRTFAFERPAAIERPRRSLHPLQLEFDRQN